MPRTVDACGLVTPFDWLVWKAVAWSKFFGMKYTIEMYVPPTKGVYGYYVCPFLCGDTLVILDSPDVGKARLDLRARQRELVTARFEAAWKSEIATNVASLIRVHQLDESFLTKQTESDGE